MAHDRFKLARSARESLSEVDIALGQAFAGATMVAIVGQLAISFSFARLALLVTTSFVDPVWKRCSIALGPKAVKSGW